jgi:hypothetical protein
VNGACAPEQRDDGNEVFLYNVQNEEGTVAQVRRTALPSSETVRFIHPDHLGNPDAVTSPTTTKRPGTRPCEV